MHVLTKTATQVLDGSTPFEKWTRKKLHISYFLMFGCLAYKHISKELGKKFDPKSKKMTFEEYFSDNKAYHLLDT